MHRTAHARTHRRTTALGATRTTLCGRGRWKIGWPGCGRPLRTLPLGRCVHRPRRRRRLIGARYTGRGPVCGTISRRIGWPVSEGPLAQLPQLASAALSDAVGGAGGTEPPPAQLPERWARWRRCLPELLVCSLRRAARRSTAQRARQPGEVGVMRRGPLASSLRGNCWLSARPAQRHVRLARPGHSFRAAGAAGALRRTGRGGACGGADGFSAPRSGGV